MYVTQVHKDNINAGHDNVHDLEKNMYRDVKKKNVSKNKMFLFQVLKSFEIVWLKSTKD